MEKVSYRGLFNSSIEIGLRILFLFKNTRKNSLDMQRLIYYNYLQVHSSDIPNSPKSLHPDLPNRSCEILISRDIISEGLRLLLSKGLLSVEYSKNGLRYKKSGNTMILLGYLDSKYSKELDERAAWVCGEFDGMIDNKLDNFMQTQLGKWGSEFSIDYRVMGDEFA